ncbi:MAG: hypothetical protein CMO66_05310 [Verrucomicrobiales bacterium]|nr:hypothetical protein [Verrucomicrobiales bacterium]|tara:strand:- start:978 stop:1937 length:960 start_codon:yes stop_codon:yes gene_type:complete
MMKKGKIAAKMLTIVFVCLLGAIVVEAFASTPLFLNRINLRTWGRRSNIPLAVGNPITGVFQFGHTNALAPQVPIYLSTNRSRNPEVLRVLFVGNGLTGANDMVGVLNTMAVSGKFRIEAEARAHEGYTLQSHVGDLRTYMAITNVITDPNNFTNALPLDAVVMQEHSVLPIYNYPLMTNNIRLLTQAITNQGSLPMLFQTWKRSDPIFSPTDVLFRTDSAYMSVGQQQNIPVVPCGMAWELSEWRRPDIILRQSDGFTPNIRGTYLNACMFYAYLTWQSPVGLNNGGLHAIPSNEIAFLQNIAWEIFLWRKDGLKFWQ